MKRLGVLCLSLALTLCCCALPEPQEPTATSSPTPAPEPAPILAYFGSSAEPWNDSLRDAAADWCDGAGWDLVDYDCLGLPETQAVQVADLERCGGAEMAVLCAVGGAGLEERATALSSGGAKVITLADTPLETPELPHSARCHLGLYAPEAYQVTADFCRRQMAENTGLILLHDMATQPLEAVAAAELAGAGIPVLEETASWGSVDYARDFLADALTRHGDVGAVLTFSRTGALGARLALDAAGLADVKLLCLDCTEELLADLDADVVDGLLTLRESAAADQLKDALTRVAKGETPGGIPLALDARFAP